jgi:enoyl-CoA hydratase/carnithine racemase
MTAVGTADINPPGRVVLSRDEGVAVITLDRPHKNNAFTLDMLQDWREALMTCRDDPDVRVIVLTGAGGAFCSGGDIGDLTAGRSLGAYDIKMQFQEQLHVIARLMADIDKPAIAAVNGQATGAGLDMALFCDMRFAAPGAVFAATYARFGLFPGNGGTYFLPRLVGTSRALEMFWSAEPMGAQEALRIGLVNRITGADTLMAETMDFAKLVCTRAQAPVRMIKRAVYQQMDMELRAALDMTASHVAITRLTVDHEEALRAFVEKRRPDFTGR